MPELPEVETIVRTLRPCLTGRIIDAVHLLRPDIVSPAGLDLAGKIAGRRIADLFRRGKKIVFELDNGARFYIHLGMTGRLTLQQPGQRIVTHTHLILLSEAGEIRFVDPRRFGGLFWLGAERSADEGLGPEPLEMKATELAERLARTGRAIKTTLLDQTIIAGLGNIYADESLFGAGIHPLTPAKDLSRDQIARLNRKIKQVLRQALRHGGSTLRDYRNARGEPGAFQKLHRVYDRAGMPCAVCLTKIERIVLTGRSAHFCPRCQNSGKSRRRTT